MRSSKMLTDIAFKASFLAMFFGTINAHPGRSTRPHDVVSEVIGKVTTILKSPKPVAPVVAKINGLTVSSNTSTAEANVTAPATVVAATSVQATILILARDTASAYSASSGLNGYGIPYQVITVPSTGINLPVLNSSETAGNYGAIVTVAELSYDYGNTTGYQSAITSDQWAAIYQYQVSFGVRLVRIDVFPSPSTGTTALGDCCEDSIEQLVSFSSTAGFPTAGLKTGAGVSTSGIWHYPANVTNSTIATEFLQFAATTGFSTASTAGVINNIDGRQQMVFFLGFSTDWSLTSNYLQHAWIQWATRGLYTGYRRVNLNTQVDDLFLTSDIYSPNGTTFQLTTGDLEQHKTWSASLNSQLPTGSNYFMELCHNGNGNIENADPNDDEGGVCGIGPIEYGDQIDTALEFQKPIGTGTNLWPSTPDTYPYNTTCTTQDKLEQWFAVADNLAAFAHVSHTFTHEDQNNATYFDVSHEIAWNQAWLKQVGIDAASSFSPKGLVPPAITGLHNGDALRAWSENGIVHAVGDNTRSALLNTENEFWPLYTTSAANGFDGIQITPRWATNIYYNCDLPDCTVEEWQNTAGGQGDWNTLIAIEKATNTRHLLSLHRDPFMFHQANLNYENAKSITVNGVAQQRSLLQAWVETVTQEYTRLVNWPIISLKHDDFSVEFANRMTRDKCLPALTYTTDPTAKTITGVTLTATSNTCRVTIPVTVPGSVTDTQGFTTEQIGSDPLTIWVQLSGSPVTFTLTTPVAF